MQKVAGKTCTLGPHLKPMLRKIHSPIYLMLPLAAIALLLASCGGDGSAGTDDGTTQKDSVEAGLDPEKGNVLNVGGKLFSIPSPVQTSLLIRKLALDHDPGLTNDPGNVSRYSSKAQMALNLGVYGADLGYATVFDDAQGALGYIKTIQKLADGLDVGSAFDEDILQRFNNSMGNEDSLLVIAGEAFRASDAYLKNSERHDVAALVLAGGWVESLHFSVEGATSAEDAVLMRRIAEQKTPLRNLVELLKSIDAEGEHAELIGQLQELQGQFDGLETMYHYEAPTVVKEEKTTYINSTVDVDISAEQLNAIAEKVRAIRAAITA